MRQTTRRERAEEVTPTASFGARAAATGVVVLIPPIVDGLACSMAWAAGMLRAGQAGGADRHGRYIETLPRRGV